MKVGKPYQLYRTIASCLWLEKLAEATKEELWQIHHRRPDFQYAILHYGDSLKVEWLLGAANDCERASLFAAFFGGLRETFCRSSFEERAQTGRRPRPVYSARLTDITRRIEYVGPTFWNVPITRHLSPTEHALSKLCPDAVRSIVQK